MQWTTDRLRKLWLDFWKAKQHEIIPSASVLPENDPTALFHNSGMHPLVPYLMGQAHPKGKRLANAQKCIRTIDIDEVGDATHLTFFEMLGNWSLGDYFKDEMIGWSYEFLFDVLKLPKNRIAVSVFTGDADAPKDEFSAERWEALGMAKNRIAFLGKEDNWWAKGDTGPCGPDTEMFYWTGDEHDPILQKPYQETYEDERWVEIWNDVFMQFNKKADGTLEDLPAPNIDTGMGLERTVTVLNGQKSVYQTNAFTPILEKIVAMCGKDELLVDLLGQTEDHNSLRILADHIRTSVVLISDGVVPSNTDQGYILRRIVRRAVRHAKKLGFNGQSVLGVAQVAVQNLSFYENIIKNESLILTTLEAEEKQFQKTLEKGEKEFEKLILRENNMISGKEAFFLYETYGFPFELTQELANEEGISLNKAEFDVAFEAHQALSRAGAEKKFKGGLEGDSAETRNLHTATHLMHAGLRKVLGDHVQQKGSNITPERLRFDFLHPEKVTPDQLKEVEMYVNEAIAAKQDISFSEMETEKAFASEALGFFGHKYGDKVTVYDMGVWSKEICGGPHAKNTSELGTFKIKKEQSASKGVRRIKAVLL